MSSIKFQEHPTLFPQLHDPGLTTVTFHYNIYFFPYINVKEQEKNHNLLSLSHPRCIQAAGKSFRTFCISKNNAGSIKLYQFYSEALYQKWNFQLNTLRNLNAMWSFRKAVLPSSTLQLHLALTPTCTGQNLFVSPSVSQYPALPPHLGQSVAEQCIACLAAEVSTLQCSRGNLPLLKGLGEPVAEPVQKNLKK